MEKYSPGDVRRAEKEGKRRTKKERAVLLTGQLAIIWKIKARYAQLYVAISSIDGRASNRRCKRRAFARQEMVTFAVVVTAYRGIGDLGKLGGDDREE